MKTSTRLFVLFSFILVISFLCFYFIIQNISNKYSANGYSIGSVFESSNSDNSDYAEREGAEKKGATMEKEYFERSHQPYGSALPSEVMKNIWSDIGKLPSEIEKSVNSWRCIGPRGMYIILSGWPTTNVYSGRVKQIEVWNYISNTNYSMLLASASGGLWARHNLFGQMVDVPLTESLPTQAIGAFVMKPGDRNTIIIGTGEPSNVRTGTGFYRTSNGGVNWTRCTMTPDVVTTTYKIAWWPNSQTLVYAATQEGLYQSSDAGITWNKVLSGICSDLAISPNIQGEMWAPIWGDGLYFSNTYGDTWTKNTSSGIPTTGVGRTSISIAKSNSSVIYLLMARDITNNIYGVYKTTNDGGSWTTITPPGFEFGNNQGWYDNAIAASPANANIVLVGGTSLKRTTNGGTTWLDGDYLQRHDDYQAFFWEDAGNKVWVCDDAGFFTSTDQGANYTTEYNWFPITQFYHISAASYFPGLPTTIIGGTQDNGNDITVNGGIDWYEHNGGDGGDVSIDPNSNGRIWVTSGQTPGATTFPRQRTTNYGSNWTDINSGIATSADWPGSIKNDGAYITVTLYTASNGHVYKSTNYGNNWTFVAGSSFGITNGIIAANPFAVYYCVHNASPPYTGSQLKVYDVASNVWAERSTGFPSTNEVQRVHVHPTNSSIAYALIAGFCAGPKIFKTTNRGLNWTGIMGNLPDIPLQDIVPHPTNDNVLFLGTEMGCYKTTNAGLNWIRWNNGMPVANVVTEMTVIDSTAVNGKYYILAGSYGRSAWMRDISGDDPIGIHPVNQEVPSTYSIKQNYPNPFNPTTIIRFAIPENTLVKIVVYDIRGREVQKLVNEKLLPGTYEQKFDGSSLNSGVYFYKLIAGEFTETKKMILMK